MQGFYHNWIYLVLFIIDLSQYPSASHPVNKQEPSLWRNLSKFRGTDYFLLSTGRSLTENEKRATRFTISM
jgi:hypothetical protein